MKVSAGSMRRRSYTVFWFLIFVVITSLCFVLSLLVNPIWWILFPISLFIIFILQMMSRYFWLEKNNCPRCNSPISKYGETCKKCGFKLWFKCLSCGTYLRVDTKFCDKCNMELKHTSKERTVFEHEIIKKEPTLFEIPNFCPNCGEEVIKRGSIKFCEKCGEALY